MPNIRPVSDLRNYAEVLKEIAFDEPVFLRRMEEVVMRLLIWKKTKRQKL